MDKKLEMIRKAYEAGGNEAAAEVLKLCRKTEEMLGLAAAAIRYFEEEAEILKKQETELHLKRDRLNEAARGFRRTAADAMAENGFETFLTDSGKLRLREFISVEITDEELLPQKYFIKKPALDKDRLKEDLKKGIEVPGAELVHSRRININ